MTKTQYMKKIGKMGRESKEKEIGKLPIDKCIEFYSELNRTSLTEGGRKTKELLEQRLRNHAGYGKFQFEEVRFQATRQRNLEELIKVKKLLNEKIEFSPTSVKKLTIDHLKYIIESDMPIEKNTMKLIQEKLMKHADTDTNAFNALAHMIERGKK